MALDDAMDAWQQQLEAVRMAFASDWADDDERDMALEDLGKAKDALEVAWLELQFAAGAEKPASGAEERHGANSRPEPFFDIGLTTSDDGGEW